jgi:hypothetical protein
VIDRPLGPLRLEIVEDARELGDLFVAEIELVGEEAQRPANAERAASEVAVVASVPTKVSCPGRGAAETVAAFAAACGDRFGRLDRVARAARAVKSVFVMTVVMTMRVPARVPPIGKTGMHSVVSFSPRLSHPAGFETRGRDCLARH